MQQVVLRNGAVVVIDVPSPPPRQGFLLVGNRASVISTGTERSALQNAQQSLSMRAIRNPDLVVKALRHVRHAGLKKTAEVAREATSGDTLLGYSSAGVVVHTGGVSRFSVGQEVACAGAGFANHADVVSVPAHLAAAIPLGVPLSDAAFTTLGAIALQGLRRAEPTLGERFVVVGLGLLGLLTVQLLRAAGCRVAGIEPLHERRMIAEQMGAELVATPEHAATEIARWTGGVGADATLVTASGSESTIVNSAVSLLRPKGRVVLVGAVGLDLARSALYEREADVLMSTAYGPGRYDASYEERGLDYPIGYVRWTENRNMEEFLRLLAVGSVRVDHLAGLQLPAARATEAYASIASASPPLALLLSYGEIDLPVRPRTAPRLSARHRAAGTVAVAVVGAGSFVRSVHLPNLTRDPQAEISVVVSRTATVATDVARAAGAARAETDWRVAINDPATDLVLIGTRHDSHAEIAASALRAGKAVFVEKPLGVTRDQIDDVWAAAIESGNPRLAIGFNRPLAPLALKLSEQVRATGGPLQVVYRVNAPLPTDSWLNDPVLGGGRILGEACHMYDFVNWLCGTPRRVLAAALPTPDRLRTVESASTTITYDTGSVATVVYSGAGGIAMPKERIEVMCGGRSWLLDDFRSLTSYESAEQVDSTRRQDKGHAKLLSSVLQACRDDSNFEPGLWRAYTAQSVALAVLASVASAEFVDVSLPSVAPASAFALTP